jgi:hypothetical protein
MGKAKTLSFREYLKTTIQSEAALQTGITQGMVSQIKNGNLPDFSVTVAPDGLTVIDAFRFRRIGKFQEKNTGQDS